MTKLAARSSRARRWEQALSRASVLSPRVAQRRTGSMMTSAQLPRRTRIAADKARSSTRTMPLPFRLSPSGSCPANRASRVHATPACSTTSIWRLLARTPICRISIGGGLAALNAYCRETYKKAFAQLDTAQQEAVITALEQGKATGFTWPSGPAFFNTLRTHTMEGMFADPIYGGNKDFAGWRLVGFPGAQPVFSPEDLQSKNAFAGPMIIGLQAQASVKKG